jgi:hyperosmotically inducible periplasmic protein
MLRIFVVSVFAVLAAVGCEKPQSMSPSSAKKDNTGVNERDRSNTLQTPINQNENQKDIDVTANIRKRVVDTKMSVNAQNVKIITQDGKVTLRGPVKTDDEKKQIEQIANEVAGVGNVDSQLEIQP